MSSLLVVAPHPDDEALGCGGIVAANIVAGNEVEVLFLTSGEYGCPGMDIAKAAAIREAEARAASMVLGSSIVDFWRLPDGRLAYNEEIRDRLIDLIEDINPDTIFVTHERESHPDHRVAGRLVREAVGKLENKPQVLTYEVWTPLTKADRLFNISGVIDKKTQAIRAHTSQVNRQSFDDSAIALARYRGVMQGRCEYAEAFGRMRLNGEDHMRITLALLTWAPSVNHPRAAYAYTTLNAAIFNLDPGDNELRVHIADDGSAPEHIDRLIAICHEYGFEPTITNSERGGYGKSYNLMMQAVHDSTDLVLPLEDDWELTRPLKLENIAKAIETSDGVIRCVRMGYLGFTQELRGKVVSVANQLFLLLDPDSPEPHVFAGHPRLESVAYQRDVGAWPEGIAAGQTEWEVTHRWPARTGVVWPMDLGIPASQDWGTLFAHIGSEGTGEVIPEAITSA